MPTIVIAEKPSQAADIRAAVGTKYGEILAAQGHLFRLEEPHENDPAWKAWTDVLLLPKKGRFDLVADRNYGKGPRIDAIKSALKTATLVIIATDCDREGQVIGQNALEYLKYNGPVKRAIFTAQDPVSLQTSFSNLHDNVKFHPVYNAGVARQQGDQIFNLTLTRVASNNLRKNWKDPVIGIGRVKTPTMGIVCLRELEIRAFRPTDYFIVKMTVKGAAGAATISHEPPEDQRILDAKRADAITAAAKTFVGPVRVKVERGKRQSPPRPYDLPSLQKAAGSALGWTAKRTLETAQRLYEEHKITTYPRGESRYLPENMIPTAGPLLTMLKAIPAYSPYPLTTPEIRTGQKGVWCDKKLEGVSHHAIIPNINCPGSIASTAARLKDDDAKLFDLIARAFLACIGEDRIYDKTTIEASVPTPAPSPCLFKATGAVTVKAGFRAILDDPGDDEDGAVAPLKDGETVTATDAKTEARQTKPPPRYTEGSLIEAMANAWKFIADPAERDRLKEAKGIGTPATRDTIIDDLKRQNLLTPTSDRKFIVPTDAGLELYHILMKAEPALLDPGATARMETRLDDVAAGRATADDVIREIAALADHTIPKIKAAGSAAKISNAAAPRPKIANMNNITRPVAINRAGRPQTAAPKTGAARPSTPPAHANGTALPGTALKVPFDRKDEAKALGARWDSTSKTWFCPQGASTAPFKSKGFL